MSEASNRRLMTYVEEIRRRRDRRIAAGSGGFESHKRKRRILRCAARWEPVAVDSYSMKGLPTGACGKAEVACSRASAGRLSASASEEVAAMTAKSSECRSLVFMIGYSLKSLRESFLRSAIDRALNASSR